MSKTNVMIQNILKLSDFYLNQKSSRTPWNEDWAKNAYLNYYHPLNFRRVTRVVQHGINVHFFEGLNQIIDFGSGPGTASLALLKTTTPYQKWKKLTLIDEDSAFVCLKSSEIWNEFTKNCQIVPTLERNPKNLQASQEKDSVLGVFSFVLTEGLNTSKAFPSWALDFEALMIIEPGTREDSRKLMELKDYFILKGFYVWAPCTHQSSCPLLHDSKSDWCHDQESPSMESLPLQEIINQLPIENKKLSFSYLLLRKKKPSLPTLIRVTGDLQVENGKSRQMICRGNEDGRSRKEFLSRLKRYGSLPPLRRGDLISVHGSVEQKGNELRIDKSTSVHEFKTKSED